MSKVQLLSQQQTSLYKGGVQRRGAILRSTGAWKCLLAGFIGGVGGAFAMRSFSVLWRRLGGPSSAPPGEPYSSQEWDSAAGAAEHVAKVLLARGLSAEEKRRGGAAVHYVVGGLAAAVYAAAGEGRPWLRAGDGAAFGLAFWLLGDELIMPRLSLTRAPRDYPLLAHMNSLGEHIVYGTTTEVLRRAMLRLI